MFTLLQSVGGAADAVGAAVQDMGVNHRRSGVAVAKRFLNRADVMAAFEQMGCKRMPETVGGSRLVDLGSLHGAAYRFLNQARIEMAPSLFTSVLVAPPLVLG